MGQAWIVALEPTIQSQIGFILSDGDGYDAGHDRICLNKAMPTINVGLLLIAVGFVVIGFASVSAPAIIFLGILVFAVGEMASSPRIQEFITWIAPKEKAGLYMGMNFLSVMIGAAFSGVTYTALSGTFNDMGHPEYVWYVLGAHTFLAPVVLILFTKMAGEFVEREE